MTFREAFNILSSSLHTLYDPGEAAAIAHGLLEHLTGKSRLERLLEKDATLSSGQELRLRNGVERLTRGEPLQYVTGIQWFLGRIFRVNEQVLIPRPETEELVQWIAEEQQGRAVSIFEVGTGSGCIAISLSLALPASDVTACDISTGALSVARKNAKALSASVEFMHLDFLSAAANGLQDRFDLLVSNPPYIPLDEKEKLHTNVAAFEPATALFVPAGDPLLFYRALASFGKTHLNPGGAVYCELHQDFARATAELFVQEGYAAVEIRKDIHGNERMLKARF